MDKDIRPVRLSLPRWGTAVNIHGALGRRLLRRYIAESAALYAARIVA